MEILKNAGTFEILSKTDNIIGTIAKSARTCYQSQDKSNPESDYNLVKNLLNRQHYAMIEFADMTVRFDNVSRGFTHELVRHRLCSFAQESTRYVDESNFKVVVPPHLDHRPLADWFNLNEEFYKKLKTVGYLNEDARQVLPTAIKSQIVVKANLREWIQIFKMRCDITAHWEIRELMLALLAVVKKQIPLVFDNFQFFKSDNEKIFARQIMSPINLKKEIEFYLLTGGKLEDIDPRPTFGKNQLIQL